MLPWNIQKRIYQKYNFICQYCGFDGSSFDNWLQMSLDHILPQSCGGTDEENNLIPSCRACNSFMSAMKFEKGKNIKDILTIKRERVHESRMSNFLNWEKDVVPYILSKKLPTI